MENSEVVQEVVPATEENVAVAETMAQSQDSVAVAVEVSDKPTVIVKDQSGEEVKRFDSVQEGYAYASENGLQVEIR